MSGLDRNILKVDLFHQLTPKTISWREGREEGGITPGFVKTLPSGNFSHPHPSTSQRSPGGSVAQFWIRPAQVAHEPGDFPAYHWSMEPLSTSNWRSTLRMLRQLRKDIPWRTGLMTTPTNDYDTDPGTGTGDSCCFQTDFYKVSYV